MKNNLSRTEWETHIKGWKASGESQREYCRRHGINLWTFRGHLGKRPISEPFAEVRVKPRMPETIRIEVKGRYTIEIPETASDAAIEKVLRAIEAVG
jgi:hypothetical protein